VAIVTAVAPSIVAPVIAALAPSVVAHIIRARIALLAPRIPQGDTPTAGLLLIIFHIVCEVRAQQRASHGTLTDISGLKS
jgi:hypothetical protein